MKIPKEIIDEIRRKADIVDVIGQHINLRQTGSNWRGLCPFHNEKTPSFTVNKDEGFYYCFGCKQTGNVFHFIQQHLNLTFYEAAKLLAEYVGVKLDEHYAEAEPTAEQALYKLYDIAKTFYTEKLFGAFGSPAFDYFRSRQLTDESMLKFGLGYALPGFDSLMNHFKRHHHNPETTLQSGLIKAKDGRHYDFFRDRAMFPIRDFLGRTVAFGGRTLTSPATQYKYINSADSPIYTKKATLFGLYESKQAIRRQDEALIVEGYIDVISLHQAGFNNVVAPCGTALSAEQLKSLKRHTNPRRLYLMFDGDAAGQAASISAIPAALAAGFDLNIIALPPGADPDSIVNQPGGPALLAELKAKSLGFIEYLYRHLQQAGQLASPAQQAAAVRSFISHILLIPDKLEHAFQLDILQAVFGPAAADLRTIYAQQQALAAGTGHSHSLGPAAAEDFGPAEIPETLVPSAIAILPVERQLLYVALSGKEGFDLLTSRGLTAAGFITPMAKDIFSIIAEHADEDDDFFQSIFSSADVNDTMRNLIGTLKTGSKNTASPRWTAFSGELAKPSMAAEVTLPLCQLRLQWLNIELEDISKQLLAGGADDKLPLRRQELLIARAELLEQVRGV